MFLRALKEAPLGTHSPAFIGSRPSAFGHPLVHILAGSSAHSLTLAHGPLWLLFAHGPSGLLELSALLFAAVLAHSLVTFLAAVWTAFTYSHPRFAVSILAAHT